MECHQSVIFGDDNVFSWDITILDTDFHPIFNQDNKVLNREKPILIGNNVWVGCKAILLKGIHIADGTVIAAGTIVTQSVDSPHAVIGNEGSKLRYLKTNIRWTPECL